MSSFNKYATNVITSIIIAFCALIFFEYVLNLKSQVVLAIAFFGVPHFLFATLANFSFQPKKAILPYAVATAIAITFALFLKSLPGIFIAQIIFFTYFLTHLLKDEFMLEESAKNGYKTMVSSLPNLTQLSLLLIPVLVFIVFGFNTGLSPLLNFPAYFGLIFLIPVPFLYIMFIKSPKIPSGFIIFFICLTSLFFFWMGKQSFQLGVEARAFIGIYHFAAWYVFYTKKLSAKTKALAEKPRTNIIFAFKNSPKSFLFFIIILHVIMFGALALYLLSPVKLGTQFVFGEGYWQFWTIWHVTTSFLGKTDFAPLFSPFWPSKQRTETTASFK